MVIDQIATKTIKMEDGSVITVKVSDPFVGKNPVNVSNGTRLYGQTGCKSFAYTKNLRW